MQALYLPNLKTKEKSPESVTDIQGLMKRETVHVWSKVLEHTVSCEADGGQDMAAVFGKVLPVIEGIDISWFISYQGKQLRRKPFMSLW